MQQFEFPIKIVLAKVGLDGHDRGIKVLARSLRNEGMDIIYLGMRLKSEQIAAAAAEEDADVVGVSILSGAHLRLVPKVIEALKLQEIKNRVILIVGGTIPIHDVELLKKMGVDGVFPIGASMNSISTFIKESVRR
jgi:methylmalonyl-CoA mutase C-terminal domain/subunit